MKTALLQLNVSDDPAENLVVTLDLVRRAAEEGATFILTPEVTNCISSSREQQQRVIRHEEEDDTFAALCAQAANLNVWILIGSLALKAEGADDRLENRSVLVGPDGNVVARYDKIHMFDVQVSKTETYKESASFRPGTKAVLARTPFANIGMTICYDVRFPHLYRALAQAGAEILTVPAAFSAVTGKAHWHSLLRARAIENGCFVLAPAQTGTHKGAHKTPRKTYGHSLVVSPWGEVLMDAGEAPGFSVIDLDLQEVAQARQKIASLTHDRDYDAP